MKEENIKKGSLMINLAKTNIKLPDDKRISDSTVKKINRYFRSEDEVSYRYIQISYVLFDILNNKKDNSQDFRLELKSAIIMMCKILNNEYHNAHTKTLTKEHVEGIFSYYIRKIKPEKPIYDINKIRNDINEYKKILPKYAKYSFRNGTKILTNDSFDGKEATKSIIHMLFARDYYNFDALLLLRNYLITSCNIEYYLNFSKHQINSSNNLLNIFLSDWILISDIINIYYRSFQFDNVSFLNNVGTNTKVDRWRFCYLCMLIYARFIIVINTLIIDSTNLRCTTKGIIKRLLIKIYRALGLEILDKIFRNLSMFELIWFLNFEIIDDICLYSGLSANEYKLKETMSMVSSIYADYAHNTHKEIIENIVNEALTMWTNDCKYDDIAMIEYFKNLEMYKPYFVKRGFLRKLKRMLREMMIDKGINRFRKYEYYRKGT